MNIIRLKRKVPENLYDEVLHDQNYYNSQHAEVQIENVNEYPNSFFSTLIIYTTMGNFRPPHLTCTHVYN